MPCYVALISSFISGKWNLLNSKSFPLVWRAPAASTQRLWRISSLCTRRGSHLLPQERPLGARVLSSWCPWNRAAVCSWIREIKVSKQWLQIKWPVGVWKPKTGPWFFPLPSKPHVWFLCPFITTAYLSWTSLSCHLVWAIHMLCCCVFSIWVGSLFLLQGGCPQSGKETAKKCVSHVVYLPQSLVIKASTSLRKSHEPRRKAVNFLELSPTLSPSIISEAERTKGKQNSSRVSLNYMGLTEWTGEDDYNF